jgi:hypothetical protein
MAVLKLIISCRAVLYRYRHTIYRYQESLLESLCRKAELNCSNSKMTRMRETTTVYLLPSSSMEYNTDKVSNSNTTMLAKTNSSDAVNPEQALD